MSPGTTLLYSLVICICICIDTYSIIIYTLDCKEIKPVNSKGNQPWIFTGRTDAEAEAPVFWKPDAKSQLTGKDTDTEAPVLLPPHKKMMRWKRPWSWERWKAKEGSGEGWNIGWHHRFNGHGFEQTLGDGEGQGSLACWSPWVKKSQTQLSDNNNSVLLV